MLNAVLNARARQQLLRFHRISPTRYRLEKPLDNTLFIYNNNNNNILFVRLQFVCLALTLAVAVSSYGYISFGGYHGGYPGYYGNGTELFDRGMGGMIKAKIILFCETLYYDRI